MALINKSYFRPLYNLFSSFLFDPLVPLQKIRAFPYFLRNLAAYLTLNTGGSFRISLIDFQYTTSDRFLGGGTDTGHYFHQDMWAAGYIYKNQIDCIVDVGSRIDGFIAHVLPFCRVVYIDIRPLRFSAPNFEYRQGTILDLPFPDSTVKNISSLHVIEHIGLGRYGDPVDPDGYKKAAQEIIRVMAPGGRLILGAPVGRERLCFDAHRVFDPATICAVFSSLSLIHFSLIDDQGNCVVDNVKFEDALKCNYGCGLFVFEKTKTTQTATRPCL